MSITSAGVEANVLWGSSPYITTFIELSSSSALGARGAPPARMTVCHRQPFLFAALVVLAIVFYLQLLTLGLKIMDETVDFVVDPGGQVLRICPGARGGIPVCWAQTITFIVVVVIGVVIAAAGVGAAGVVVDITGGEVGVDDRSRGLAATVGRVGRSEGRRCLLLQHWGRRQERRDGRSRCRTKRAT